MNKEEFKTAIKLILKKEYEDFEFTKEKDRILEQIWELAEKLQPEPHT